MNIAKILEDKPSGVISISASDTVKMAADVMVRHRIAALVVMQNDTVVGMVSEREIVEALSTYGSAAGRIQIKQISSRRLVTVSPSESIKRAMSLMTHGHARHLLVMEKSRLVGIVSLGDIVKHRLEEVELESNVLRDIYIAAR